MENCYSTGNVSGYYYVGGLIGEFSGKSLENCYSTGNVSGYYYVGGLIGNLYNEGYSDSDGSSSYNISSCHSTANVSGTYNVGGLIGYLGVYCYMSYSEIYINSCYAKTTITGNNQLGGLIGCIEGDGGVHITKCHTDCEITCNDSYAAGIVGYFSGYGYEFYIRYCYANVKILANYYAAGILAASYLDSNNIEQCYSTGEIVCNNAAGVMSTDYSYGGYYVADCFSTMFLPLTSDYNYGYDYNTNCCYRAQGYSPDLGWSSGPETWENSGAWETPIASFPKLLNVGGQED